jgi:uncharacterized protein YhbP (UPF0306 family)
MDLTKELILDFLAKHNVMSIATSGDHPWIAYVYFSFDSNLTIYFLSSPKTLHCRQIAKNPHVALLIADSHQKVGDLKKGVQIYGVAEQISDAQKVKHALRMWRDALQVTDPTLTYENMIKKVINGRMYKVTPKKIKFFNQELFKVEDGDEPVLEFN